MITLGIDIGSSSIKVSLFDADAGKSIARVSYPSIEMEIISAHRDWAEQDPELWMENLFRAIEIIRSGHAVALSQVKAIGISYQMHGLVMVDKNGKPIRNAIIWCDSRAVDAGNEAYERLGKRYCLSHLLNSPGNFTASKLKWVKDNEPGRFDRIFKIMLPGEYVAYRLTGEIRTTISGLSEGIFWDFEKASISQRLMDHFGFRPDMLPEIADTFSDQGTLSREIAEKLGMSVNARVSYRAGDQPNNALSLNVMDPGEIAATAGTSGVIYGVTNKKYYDTWSRVNTFVHVNNTSKDPRHGILLCLNSVGIMNSWLRQEILNAKYTYDEMNDLGSLAPEGSEGLHILPFGNGAERMLRNLNIGASVHGLHLTIHRQPHLIRALQEGIAFAFQYGIEIMKDLGFEVKVIRAGRSNMFLSSLFSQTLSNLCGANIELYDTDGSEGAARGAAIGAGFFKDPADAFSKLKIRETIVPETESGISEYYHIWKDTLSESLQSYK